MLGLLALLFGILCGLGVICPGMDLDINGPKVEAPSIDINGPEIEGPNIDINGPEIEGPNVDINGPNI